MQVNERQTQLALGHMTAAMTKHYIDHKTEEDLAVISKALDSGFRFGRIRTAVSVSDFSDKEIVFI